MDTSGFHGRLVRLGHAADTIIGRHAYPEVIAELLAEAMALTGALAAALKFDGVFTLQLSGDGPVKYLVSDVTSDGDLRGYAEMRAALPPASDLEDAAIPRLFGTGYLAFTVDQGVHTERYQGIVDLTGATLQDCVHHYFQQSDQFAAAVKLCGRRDPTGQWRAGALMLQRSPESEDPNLSEPTEDAWREALVMLGSCTDPELVDRDITAHGLLYRLFHRGRRPGLSQAALAVLLPVQRAEGRASLARLVGRGTRGSYDRRFGDGNLRILPRNPCLRSCGPGPAANVLMPACPGGIVAKRRNWRCLRR